MIDNTLISYMEEMLRNTPTAFKRYAYSEIDWNQRMIGIVGARGIGKSTMVKQYIIENRDQFNVLYTSADHTYFSNQGILMVYHSVSLIGMYVSLVFLNLMPNPLKSTAHIMPVFIFTRTIS